MTITLQQLQNQLSQSYKMKENVTHCLARFLVNDTELSADLLHREAWKIASNLNDSPFTALSNVFVMHEVMESSPEFFHYQHALPVEEMTQDDVTLPPVDQLGSRQVWMAKHEEESILLKVYGEEMILRPRTLFHIVGIKVENTVHVVAATLSNQDFLNELASHSFSLALQWWQERVGEELAMPLLLCVASRVISRNIQVPPLATMPINIVLPVETSPNQFDSFALQLTNFLRQTMQWCQVLEAKGREALGKELWRPSLIEGEENATQSSGLLIVPDEALLLLLESRMDNGDLSQQATDNIVVIRDVMETQELCYRCGTETHGQLVRLPADLRFCVVSCGRSVILPTPFTIYLTDAAVQDIIRYDNSVVVDPTDPGLMAAQQLAKRLPAGEDAGIDPDWSNRLVEAFVERQKEEKSDSLLSVPASFDGEALQRALLVLQCLLLARVKVEESDLHTRMDALWRDAVEWSLRLQVQEPVKDQVSR